MKKSKILTGVLYGAALTFLVFSANAQTTYDPVFEPAGTMSTAVISPGSTLLPNGNVLNFGGRERGFVSSGMVNHYDPVTDSFHSQLMKYPHDMFAMVRLSDERLILFGGSADAGIAPGFKASEMYYPAVDSFAAIAPMNRGRMMHTAAQLKSGKVLIVGGWYSNSNATYPEIYDIDSNTYLNTSALGQARRSAIVFPTDDSGAIVIGGTPSFGGDVYRSVEYYLPQTNSFSLISPELILSDSGWKPMAYETAKPIDDYLMTNGKYLFLASRDTGSSSPKEFALIEFDPATKSFAKIVTDKPLVDSAMQNGISYMVLNKIDNQAYLFASKDDYKTIALISVDLNTGNVYYPDSLFTLPTGQHMLGFASYTYIPSVKKILVSGLSGARDNFSAINTTYLVSPNLDIEETEDPEDPEDPFGVDNSLKENLHVKMYPNPINKELNIEMLINGLYKISLRDMTGRLLFNSDFEGKQSIKLNTSNLPNGLYILNVNAEAGFYQKKVMVLH